MCHVYIPYLKSQGQCYQNIRITQLNETVGGCCEGDFLKLVVFQEERKVMREDDPKPSLT